MSLFGALFSGVSGLNAQGTSMGVIADNISTIGYKTTQTNFKTLVTVAATATSFAPGGVQAAPQALIGRQGLLQSSISPTDLAINGDGFFVVNELANPTTTQGSFLYTRAGSFTKDENGNLKNAAGFFLQGWPVNATTGLIPSNRSDLTELDTVNIEGLAGTASATSSVAIQANLKASQAVTIALPTDTTLSTLTTSTTVLGNGAGTGTVTGVTDGDTITISSNIGSVSQVFTYQSTPTASSFQFSTLQEFADLVNSVDGLTATVGGTSALATVAIGGPPDGTLTIAETNSLATELFGTAGSTTVPTYAAATSTTNIASTAITPDFERSVAIFDSKGGSHTLTFGFLKSTLANTWLTEVYIEPSSETDAADADQGPNGIVAAGTVTFGSDGSINTTNFTTTIPSGGDLTGSLQVPWASALGVATQNITINWGTDDSTDGITQFDSDSILVSTTVDGAIFGELANITVTDLGVVTAIFENGVTTSIYQLPVATFSNVAGLQARSGNAYQETDLSGSFSLNEASIGGSGLVAPSTLEASTVDLAEEFAKMIVTQRAFSAATRVITTSDDMLSELIRIKG